MDRIVVMIKVSNDDLQEVTDEFDADGAHVEKEKQSDNTWTVRATYFEGPDPEFGEPFFISEAPEDEPSPGVAHDDQLGKLSERHESRGDPARIGRDSTGGFSYGKYQIATKTGTMKKYLEFLHVEHPAFADALQAAGGVQGALAGNTRFISTWKTLADDPAFADSQHAFIQATHYEPFADRLKDLPLDIRNRSLALRNVAWSVSVQHGARNDVFENALRGRDTSALTDREVMNAVYDERSKVDKYFSRSTPQVKAAVKQRFVDERAAALEMLAREGLA